MLDILLLFLVSLIGFGAGATAGVYTTTKHVEEHLKLKVKIDPRTGVRIE